MDKTAKEADFNFLKTQLDTVSRALEACILHLNISNEDIQRCERQLQYHTSGKALLEERRIELQERQQKLLQSIRKRS
jgi:hypothetical protein